MTDSVESVIRRFPEKIRAGQLMQANRFAWEVDLAAKHTPPGGTIADIGGGWGSFALGCAARGFRTTLVDDFRDSGFFDEATMGAMRALYAEYGVDVVSRDVVANQLSFAERSLDTITIFDSLEHWHNSPKRLLANVATTLRDGGTFILATPNCVNLRKRITVPLGRGKWSAMADWYETATFRGHVREPDVDDLRYIARDMNLRDAAIIGRNWNGYCSASRLTRAVTPFVDIFLRMRPSLCSDLYMVGTVRA
jgi:2-polyprenyl-3-methyl-5-hydroxy-6-metoxy-1,4-benzoquinol methylase